MFPFDDSLIGLLLPNSPLSAPTHHLSPSSAHPCPLFSFFKVIRSTFTFFTGQAQIRETCILFLPATAKHHWFQGSSMLVSRSTSESGTSSNKTGLLFLDHMLWIDLLFEVMKKGVQRLGGEFRSAEAMLRSQGTVFWGIGSEEMGGYFGSCQQELARVCMLNKYKLPI